MNHAIAERLRRAHGLSVHVGPLEGAMRRHDAAARVLYLSESLPRESRGFQMAFTLMLLEAREAIDAALSGAEPSTPEAAQMMRIGLLNYAAAALLMPYAPYLAAARETRHDIEALAARFGVSFEQAAQRLSTLQRDGARGVPFFFLRVDPCRQRRQALLRRGLPLRALWRILPALGGARSLRHAGRIRVQVARLPDGATFLTVARSVQSPTAHWGEPPPVHVVAMGCDISRAPELVYADGLTWRVPVGIGLSCRLCDRVECRSRAFPRARASPGAGPGRGRGRALPLRDRAAGAGQPSAQSSRTVSVQDISPTPRR